MADIQDVPKDLKLRKNERLQYGALCYRVVHGKTQVLLITSRTRRRWIIPKGWPIDGNAPEKSAAIEAWEEAGVRGKAEPRFVGSYSYLKLGDGRGPDQDCVVGVYPLRVKSLAEAFPESTQRRRKWFSPKSASKKVGEEGLRTLLREFEPGK